MTLTAVDPLLDVVAKAQARDAGAAREWVRLGLYEALCEEIDRLRPDFDRDIAKVAATVADDALRALTRQYVAKRDAGQDTTGLERYAEMLRGLVDVAKNDDDSVSVDEWNASPEGRQHPRDETGQWASRGRKAVGDALAVATRQDAGLQGNARAFGAAFDQGRYRQMAMLGNLLGQVSHPAAQATSAVAQLAGEVGPEAARILGGPLKRIAYRYRGTERRPDRGDQDRARVIAQIATELGTQDRKTAERREAYVANWNKNTAPRKAGQTRVKTNPMQAAIGSALDADPVSPDQARLMALSNYGVYLLRDQVPDMHRARISQAAGKMPPSVGVIFDADGHLVSVAQGFHGDHYVPFDLKNLKRLHGGQYVRTRAAGGLTDEDIYTGLLSGARAVTVVSNSGVFTLEFDPDVRGGRRYSDKARQMVGRYAAILDQLNGKILAEEFTPEQRSTMIAEAKRKAGGDPEKMTDELKIVQRRHVDLLRFADDDDLKAQAQQLAAAENRGSPQATARSAEDNLRELKAKQARVYRLDGEGYQVAQQTLAQEFPFFVRRTDAEPLREFLDDRGFESSTVLSNPRIRDIGHKPRGWTAETTGAWKVPERTAAPAAAPAAAPRDGQQPAAATTPGQQADGPPPPRALIDTDFGQRFAQQLAISWDVLQLLDSAQIDDDIDPLTLSANEYGVWLAQQTPAQATDFLLDPKNAAHLHRFRQTLQMLERKFDAPELEPYDLDDMLSLVDEAKDVTQPFDKAAPEPALAVPTAERKPQPFPDITALGFEPEAYPAFLADQPELAGLVGQLPDDNEAIAGDVRDRVRAYQRLRDAGQDLVEHGRSRPGMSGEELEQGARVFNEGPDSEEYRELLDLQRAWAFRAQHRMASTFLGYDIPLPEGDAAPKAPEESGEPEEVAHRAPEPAFRLHGPDSPLARALRSGALAKRDRQPTSH